MKHKYRLAGTGLLIAIICAGIGASTAYITDNEEKTNHFSFQNASLVIREELWGSLPEEEKVIFPKKTVAKDPVVENVGSADMYVFLEVYVPKRNIRTVSDDGKSVIKSAETPLFSFSANESWQLTEYDDENANYERYVYGYGDILKSGEKTLPLFESVDCVNFLEGELDMGEKTEVNLRAFGIQSDFIISDKSTADLSEIYEACREELCEVGDTEG